MTTTKPEPTPETDAAELDLIRNHPGLDEKRVMAAFLTARRLERERDEARAERTEALRWRQALPEDVKWAISTRDQAIADRDSALARLRECEAAYVALEADLKAPRFVHHMKGPHEHECRCCLSCVAVNYDSETKTYVPVREIKHADDCALIIVRNTLAALRTEPTP